LINETGKMQGEMKKSQAAHARIGGTDPEAFRKAVENE
jgi:hypothetical protein